MRSKPMTTLREKMLPVLDLGVESGRLTRDDAFAVLDLIDAPERLAALNIAVLRHEAETPMRGHDEDGACCRAARG